MIDLGGHVRLLTGDYLDVTEPRALHRLFDFMQEYPEQVDVRVFQTDTQRGFHPKAYVIQRGADAVTAYIGSSNLTKHALLGGIEWNQRIVGLREDPPIAAIAAEFKRLFQHQNTASLCPEWIESYEKRRKISAVS